MTPVAVDRETLGSARRISDLAAACRCDTPQPRNLPRIKDKALRIGTSLASYNDDFTKADGSRLLDELTTVVSRAAAAILAARASGLDSRTKTDLSPVTAADDAAEAIILEGVRRLLAGVPIVSEEAAERARPDPIDGDFVLVDPVDGTRELVAGRDEFTINVAVVSGGRPTLGIIAAPARGLIWRTAPAGGAERLGLRPGAPADAAHDRTLIRPRLYSGGALIAAVSRSHLDAQTEALLARLPKVERLASGSAVKLCWVAEGTAHLYPRLGPTREWDIAAGHAIVAAAGGTVMTADGKPLCYGRAAQGFVVPGFIAWGDPSAPARFDL
jgi:3'(2'), 5'-bisphosphate nucleotidase